MLDLPFYFFKVVVFNKLEESKRACIIVMFLGEYFILNCLFYKSKFIRVFFFITSFIESCSLMHFYKNNKILDKIFL